MRADLYHFVRRSRRTVRPWDVIQVKVPRGRIDNHYRVIETPVARTFTKRGAERRVVRLNSEV